MAKKKLLPQSTDAQDWADEWMKCIKKNPSIPTDVACMVGWFANAIMAGYDAGCRKHSAPYTEDNHHDPFKDLQKASKKLSSRGMKNAFGRIETKK
jgi:hypothetical protein